MNILDVNINNVFSVQNNKGLGGLISIISVSNLDVLINNVIFNRTTSRIQGGAMYVYAKDTVAFNLTLN